MGRVVMAVVGVMESVAHTDTVPLPSLTLSTAGIDTSPGRGNHAVI